MKTLVTQTLQSQRDKTIFYGAMFASLIIIAVRMFVADYQIDWDEELYYQIARGWSDGLVPYRDIFDHKPPFLYVYYWLFTGFGSSLALLRILQSLLLFYAILMTWRYFSNRINILFVPVMLALFSAKGMMGTNTELIYSPFLLFTLVLTLRGKLLAAALSAALVVSIKYTAALDILGVVLAVWIIQQRVRPVLWVSLASASVFITAHGLLILYFYSQGVDLIYETILRNIQHSSGEREFLQIHPRFWKPVIVLFLIGIISLTERKPEADRRFVIAMLIWTGLSFLQSQITGRGYFHYFVPVFIPLCLLVFHLAYNLTKARLRITGYGLTVGVAWYALSLGNYYYQKNRIDTARLSAVCSLKSFHYDGNKLFVYRLCGVQPLKYMFPQFYKSEHFQQVSGSGGMQWMRAVNRPVVADDGNEVRIFDSGQSFADYYEKSQKEEQ